jgi:hypothetical protein
MGPTPIPRWEGLQEVQRVASREWDYAISQGDAGMSVVIPTCGAGRMGGATP